MHSNQPAYSDFSITALSGTKLRFRPNKEIVRERTACSAMRFDMLHAALCLSCLMLAIWGWRARSSSGLHGAHVTERFPGPRWRVNNDYFETVDATVLFENRWMRTELHQVRVKGDDGEQRIVRDWVFMDEPGAWICVHCSGSSLVFLGAQIT